MEDANCEESAPFHNKDGEPYLESHHIEWIAKGVVTR